MLNWLILGWMVIMTIAVNIYDFKKRLILNWSILIFAILGSVFMLNNWDNGGSLGLISFGVFFVFLIAVSLISDPSAIGGGDIKFILVSTLFLNNDNLLAYAFSFFIVGIIFFIFHKMRKVKKDKEKEFLGLDVKKKEKISVAGAPTISLPLIFAILFSIYPDLSNWKLYLSFLVYILLNVFTMILMYKLKAFEFYKEGDNDEKNNKEI